MEQQLLCARCKEPIEGEPVVRGDKSFCSEACAFEATERPSPKMCGRIDYGGNSKTASNK